MFPQYFLVAFAVLNGPFEAADNKVEYDRRQGYREPTLKYLDPGELVRIGDKSAEQLVREKHPDSNSQNIEHGDSEKGKVEFEPVLTS